MDIAALGEKNSNIKIKSREKLSSSSSADFPSSRAYTRKMKGNSRRFAGEQEKCVFSSAERVLVEEGARTFFILSFR